MSRPCQRTPWRTSWRASRWPSYSPAARVPSGSAGREPARRRTSRLSEGRYDRPGLVFRDQPSRGRAALLRIRRLGVRFPPSAPHLTGVDASTRRCSAWSRPYSDPYSCRDNDRYRDGRRRARRGTGSMRERRPGVWENRDRRGEGRGHGPVGAAPSPSTAAQRSPSHAGGSWSSASGWTGAPLYCTGARLDVADLLERFVAGNGHWRPSQLPKHSSAPHEKLSHGPRHVPELASSPQKEAPDRAFMWRERPGRVASSGGCVKMSGTG